MGFILDSVKREAGVSPARTRRCKWEGCFIPLAICREGKHSVEHKSEDLPVNIAYHE